MTKPDSTDATSSGEDEQCYNCDWEGETWDRTMQMDDPHTGKKRGETIPLCSTCKSAFDMGAGNV